MKRGSGQEGFTLIEMLVAMVAGLVVFGATLSALTIANHNFVGSTQRNDAQDLARLGIDLIARQLRNISSPISSPKEIERATPYDLVFQTVGTPSGANVTGAQRVRYCIPADTATGTPAKEELISQTQTWTTLTPPASPWSADPTVTIACPDTSTATSRVVANAVTNRYQQRTDRPAFTYNNSLVAPTDLSQVVSVQTDLFINPTPLVTQAETELKSGAYLRNQLRAPVASFTPITGVPGSGSVDLDAGSSYSPSGYDLSYSWACISSLCPNAATLSGATDGLVNWQPGAGTYTVQLTVTDPSGLIGTSTQTVTVQ
jgi:prepilin-type N-terminal cleavage/methylation domain-containing protein